MRKLPKAKVSRAIIYNGPSMLDGKPIMAVLTGLDNSSTNRKTGKMVQIWIIRSDMSPIEAYRTGGDASICGDCPHRWNLGGGCYVSLSQAPTSINHAIGRGNFADWTKSMPSNALDGTRVRFGAYGDPSAVPERVWRRIRNQNLAGWTGYTRQWKQERFTYLRNFLMASVISEEEAQEAESKGWRYFRIRGEDAPLFKNEVGCPAAPENGERVTCSSCLLCAGQNHSASKSVGIIVHGNRKDKVLV
jgi:hypothetical protein